jgi:general secretion pathway protein G
MKRLRGFTLVELLVVVSIIGVLATILMTNFIGVRQRARDAQRKADLRQIQSALELYRADSAVYAAHATGTYRLNQTQCPTSNALTNQAGTATYMAKIPCDPSGSSGYNGGSYYFQSNGSAYTIAACLENTTDTEGTTTAPSPYSGTACTSGRYIVLTNP